MAQEQIDTTIRLEKRRRVSEARAFYATLEVAAGIVLEDVVEARKLLPRADERVHATHDAYLARQRIKKSAFSELRSACINLGGELTEAFLRLDNQIDTFASQWRTSTAPGGGGSYRSGILGGFNDQLDAIETSAAQLRAAASESIKECQKELAALTP